jgi:hypothetical protein
MQCGVVHLDVLDRSERRRSTVPGGGGERSIVFAAVVSRNSIARDRCHGSACQVHSRFGQTGPLGTGWKSRSGAVETRPHGVWRTRDDRPEKRGCQFGQTGPVRISACRRAGCGRSGLP